MRLILNNGLLPVLLAAMTACQATPVQAQQVSRNTTYAAAARAVSLCYAVKMGWPPRQVALWSRDFLHRHGISQDMAWGSGSTPEIRALADYAYTKLDGQCNLKTPRGTTL